MNLQKLMNRFPFNLAFPQYRNVMPSQLKKPAAAFELKDLDGHVHHLEDQPGQWLLLVFHRHLG